MDYADDDAVTSFERWEKALDALQWLGGSESDPDAKFARWAMQFTGSNSIVRLKREALINAARVEGDSHLKRVGSAFPGVDFPALVKALRVKYVEIRLTEG